MIAQPELVRTSERRNEVPHNHTGRRPIRPHGPGWVGEGNPGLFYRQTSDIHPGDLCRGPLKEGPEEDIPQRILHHLEVYPYVRGDVLHEGPLLLEGLLQSHVCGLRVPTRHPGQCGHRMPPALHLLPQPAVLRLLGTHKSPEVAVSRHNLESVAA